MYTAGMDTRDRLVAATQELLWERGYAATSPTDIQRAAEAGQGSMYHHFHGKQDLAAAALRDSAEAMRADAAALLDGPGTAIDRVEGYLRRQRDSLRGCRIGRMTFDAEVVASPDLLAPVAATLGWLGDALAAVLRDGIGSGELRADLDPRALASTVVAVVQGGYVLARAQQDVAAFDAAIDGAVILLRAVRTETPA
jgi:AcrR family transcriptional regulator